MPTIWELDYYSRPILDDQNKKTWEVLICESPLTIAAPPEPLFRYAEYCPSTQVNSAWLKTAILSAIAHAPRPPDKIRFFRQAMTNMITKACEDANLPVVLSRRTFTLGQWLAERMATVYPQMPGFQVTANPSVVFPTTPPQPLPDALWGQKWALVSLPVSAFADLAEWAIAFGEVFPLDSLALAPDTLIPGLIIYSARAVPLAAWLYGLELAAIQVDREATPRLVLATGVSDRWILSGLNERTQTEADQFVAAQQTAQSVHFLAIQADPEVEAFAGFWLLQGANLA
jgi:RNA-binding protein Tab2/Atab2